MPEVPYVPIPEGSMISTDTLHEAVQAHIAQCAQCSDQVSRSGPAPMGTKSGMCGEYFNIIKFFASGETL